MTPTLSEKGKEQFIDVRVKFRVTHSPDTEFHLKKLLTLNGLKGEVVEEDGILTIYQ